MSQESKEKVGEHLPELLLVLEFQVVRHDRVDHLDREDQLVQGSRCHLSLLFHRSLSGHHPDLLFLQGILEPLEVQENPVKVEEWILSISEFYFFSVNQTEPKKKTNS